MQGKSPLRIKLVGRRVYLRNLRAKDITREYIQWLNDPEVNRFISARRKRQTRKTVLAYVNSFKGRKDKLLLGIFLKENGRHIGNLTLSNINWESKFSVVGICLGNKLYWRKGFSLESLRLVEKGFDQ